MRIGIPAETATHERRVAATPESIERFRKLGFEVCVEHGAGQSAGFSDEAYRAAGAVPVSLDDVWTCDVILKVRPLSEPEVLRTRAGQVVVGFVFPAQHKLTLDGLSARRATLIAMDCVPRISRAQKMDALSSMANIAGYRAVIEAATHFGRFFAGQVTAAGKVAPAKVLIIGAGVAGLAAIGAARGLGAIVRAFDTRPVVREQVQSLGAEFLEVTLDEDGNGEGGYAKEMSPAFIAKEMELFAEQARDVDVIITTALIPGKPAPKLISTAMVDSMRPGSVIVDLAAEQGGNCELTRPGEHVAHALPQGGVVQVLGFTDLTSRMAAQASQLYANNLAHLLSDMGGAAGFRVDFDDEVVRGATVVHEGAVTWPPPKKAAPPPAPAAAPATTTATSTTTTTTTATSTTARAPQAASKTTGSKPAGKAPAHGHSSPASGPSTWALLIAGMCLFGLGSAAPPAFLSHLIVFVLACFVGYQVIWNVTPALHTPLMSVTNAISGIILVGGMLHASADMDKSSVPAMLGAAAILVATINIAGGFLVTQRMLKMFRKG